MSAVSPAVQRGADQLGRALAAHGWHVTVEIGRPRPIATQAMSVRAYDAKGRLLVRVTVSPSTRGGMGRMFTVWPMDLPRLYPRTVLTLGSAGEIARRYTRETAARILEVAAQ